MSVPVERYPLQSGRVGATGCRLSEKPYTSEPLLGGCGKMTRSAWSAGVLGFCMAVVCTQRSLGQLPSFCLRFDESCLAPGGLHVDAVVGASAYRIAAAQFSIRFDPALLTVVDVLPGRVCDPNSPFALELIEVVDPGGGQVVYAVGVDFLSGLSATEQSATLACV